MATIVKRIRTGARYVLVGTGFGAFESAKPNWLLGDLVGDLNKGKHTMAAVCDQAGRIYWIKTQELEVESVDGQSPNAILESQDPSG